MRGGARVSLALAAVLAASGCGDTFVDPFLRDAAPYSLYGTVTADFTARLQRVRVQRIRATVDPPTDTEDAAALIDGAVTSVDPASGAPLTWTPRTLVYADGTVGTVFERSFQPAPDSRLDVVYTDRAGRAVRGEVVLPPTPPGTVLDPVVPDPIEGSARQRVMWTGARFHPEAVVDYTGLDSLGRPHSIRVLYEVVPTEGGAEVDLALTEDLSRLALETGVDDDGFIRELRVRMDATALSDLLPPIDVIPSDDLGRVFLAGATVGRVFWSPRVKPVIFTDS